MSEVQKVDNNNLKAISDDSNVPELKPVNEVFNDDEDLFRWCMFDVFISPLTTPFMVTMLPIYLVDFYRRYKCASWPNQVCDSDLVIGDSYVDQYNFNVTFLGIEMQISGMLWVGVVISVFLQLIGLLFITPISDQDGQRNSLFKVFGWLVIVTLVAGQLLAISASLWYIIFLQVIFTVLFQNLSQAVQNSFAPELVRSNVQIEELREKIGEDNEVYKDQTKSLLNLSFGTAFSWGQVASLIQLVLFLIVQRLSPDLRDKSNDQNQVYLTMGVTAFVLCSLFFVIYRIKEVKGEKWPGQSNYLKSDKIGINFMCKLGKFPQLGKLLLTWFFLSDLNENAGTFLTLLFRRQDVPFAQQSPILLTVYTIFPIGTQIILKLRETQQLHQFTILKIATLINLIVCGAGVFLLDSYLVEVSWVFGIVQGFSIGSFQTLMYSAIGQVTPDCYDASVYSIIQVTNKGSSFLTPIVLVLIEYQSVLQDNRAIMTYGIFWYFFLYMIPLGMFFLIDLELGQKDKLDFDAERKESKLNNDNQIMSE